MSNDTITDSFGSAVDIDSGIDDDLVTIGATFGSGTVEGGAGFDTLSLSGAVNLASLDVRGFERLYLNTSATARAVLFDAFDRIAISAANLTGTVTLTLAADGGPGPIILDLSDELSDGGVRGVVLTGSGDAEAITTGDGADSINGGDGNDTVNSGLGNDTLIGGAGDDVLNGGFGNDVISDSIGGVANIDAGADDDSVTVGSNFLSGSAVGGTGTDTLTLSSNFDFTDVSVSGFETLAVKGRTATGRASDFQAFGTIYYDLLNPNFTVPVNLALSASGFATSLDLTASFGNGGIRAVNLTGTSDDETLTLTSGNDSVVANDGNDSILGAGGNDTIDAGAGGDTINGGTGNDSLSGGIGSDSILGGIGNDQINGGDGNDTLDGEDGIDTVSYANSSAAVIVSLVSLTATSASGNDTIANVENVTGSDFNDKLTGDAGANLLDGGLGNDSFVGGDGNDTFRGGGGIDTVSYAAASSSVTANTVTGQATGAGVGNDSLSGIGILIGSAFDDVLTVTSAAYGGDGNDTIQARGGAASLLGEGGNDRFVFDYADYQPAPLSFTTLDGGSGFNTVYLKDTSTSLSTPAFNFGGSRGHINHLQRFDVSSQETTATESELIFYAGQFTSGELASDLQFAGAIAAVSIFFFEFYDGTSVSNLDLSQVTFDSTALPFSSPPEFRIFDHPNTTVLPAQRFKTVIGTAYADTFEFDYSGGTIDGGNGTDSINLAGRPNNANGVPANDGLIANRFGTSSTIAMSFVMTSTSQPTILTTILSPQTLLSITNVENIRIRGVNGDDRFVTLGGNDELIGGGGNDTLDGGAGADILNGGDGSDFYFVDNTGDVVTETNAVVATGGYDIVTASANYTLSDNVEQLVILGGATQGTGGNTANYLYGGNSGLSLRLDGGGGDDVIYAGLAGGNTLIGGSGVDTLLIYGGDIAANNANGGIWARISTTPTASMTCSPKSAATASIPSIRATTSRWRRGSSSCCCSAPRPVPRALPTTTSCTATARQARSTCQASTARMCWSAEPSTTRWMVVLASTCSSATAAPTR